MFWEANDFSDHVLAADIFLIFQHAWKRKGPCECNMVNAHIHPLFWGWFTQPISGKVRITDCWVSKSYCKGWSRTIDLYCRWPNWVILKGQQIRQQLGQQMQTGRYHKYIWIIYRVYVSIRSSFRSVLRSSKVFVWRHPHGRFEVWRTTSMHEECFTIAWLPSRPGVDLV